MTDDGNNNLDAPIQEKVMPNGNRYKGQMLNGKFHGHGEFFWVNGNHYVGSYVNNKIQGKGVYKQ